MRSSFRHSAKILAILAAVIAVGVAWRLWPDQKGRIIPIGARVDMAALPEFINALEEAREIVVFEGLPHPYSEHAEFEKERNAKKCVELRGYWFYDEARVAWNEDFNSLRRALAARGGIIEWGGNKLCGGFHPDYLIRWKVAGGTCDALICFGCHEIKLFGPRDRLYADLSKQTYEQLKQGLAKFRKHRPQGVH